MEGMRARQEGEDLRQRRSKHLLSQALLDLMGERSFREITIVDICQRAMVHRTTFYAHFKDKTDLLRYVLLDLKRAFHEKEIHRDSASLRECLLQEFYDCLTFLRENQRIYLSGMNGGDQPEIRVVEEVLAESLYDRFRNDSTLLSDPELAETAAWFYAGGLLAVVRWWLQNGAKSSEAELAERVGYLLPAHPEA